MTETGKDKERSIERIEACPACGGRSLSAFKKANFEVRDISPEDVKITDKAYGKVWDLDRCADCTHVFANPRPSPRFIQSLYGDIIDPVYQDEAEGRQKNFERILERMERLQPAKGPLFDVGAATGILMNMARERGEGQIRPSDSERGFRDGGAAEKPVCGRDHGRLYRTRPRSDGRPGQGRGDPA
jgi:hypothetical protein